jgi:uncharacterized membrane protein YvlD (DUF360 family)
VRGALRRLTAFYGLQLRLLRTWRPGRRALILRIVVSSVVAYLALAIAIWAVPGLSADGIPSILAAVGLIAALNTLLRPVLLWLALPLGILGIAVLGVALQLVVILVAAIVVPGIHLADPIAAVQATLVFGIATTAISWFIALGEDESYFSHLVRLLITRDTAPISTPGIVFVQIDGLAGPILLDQVRAGRVPTMARWIRSGSHTLTPWECRLPSQTSASQAGILLGANDGIPAFRWYEKEGGRLLVSNRPADATEIEARLSTGRGLLADGGSSIGNLFSGDATESILTMSRLGHAGAALGPTRSWFYFFISPFALARAIFLTLGEAGKELWQARRQRVNGIEPRIHRGGAYPLLRGVTNVLLRQVTSALVVERMMRGVPVVYADFVDYDEIAHHAGPQRGESLDALDGVDRVLGMLERIAGEAPRPYRIVVLSDHGQSQGATFRQRYGITLEAHVRSLIGEASEVEAATSASEPWGPINALLTESGVGGGVGGRLLRRVLSSRTRAGSVELGPGRAPREPNVAASSAGRPDLVVCASGNLGLVYLTDRPGRRTLEELRAEHPRLVDGLARHPGVGFVLVRSAVDGPVVIGSSGTRCLDRDEIIGDDPLTGFGPDAADDLRRLDAMPNVPDLVLNSRLDPATDEVAAFEELVGSHGGLGGAQTRAFLLHPAEWPAGAGRLVGAEAVHRQLVAWLVAAGLRPAPAALGTADADPAVRHTALPGLLAGSPVVPAEGSG